MVDFQSRDTRRGFDDAGEDGANDGSETTQDGPADANRGGSGAGVEAAADATLGVAVASVSGTRTVDDDPAGDAVIDLLESGAFALATREVLKPSFDGVQGGVDTLVERDDVDVLVTVGGVGVGPSHVTCEAVTPLMDTRLPGVGEFLRSLASEEVGCEVVSMRPTGGVIAGVPVFCLPEEEWAARLGASEIVVPEAERIADAADGDDEDDGGDGPDPEDRRG